MMPDDIERTIQFLLSQQAQFAADLTTWRERSEAEFTRSAAALAAWRDEATRQHGELRSIVGEITTVLKETIGIVNSLAESQAATDRRIEGLTAAAERHDEADRRHEASAARHDKEIAEQRELGREMDRRLNSLILFVEERERRRAEGEGPPH